MAEYRAKFNGSCSAGARCVHGGRITVGQLIDWNRKRRGMAWHVECRAERVPAPEREAPETEKENQNVETETEWAPPIPGKLERHELEQETPADPLVAALVDKLQPWIKAHVDADALKAEVTEEVRANLAAVNAKLERALKQAQPTRVELVTPEQPEARDLGVQHRQFPLLLKALNARQSDGHHLNVWLTGPAGSGKTTAALQAAKALSLEYAFTGAIDTPYPLLGFVDAQGRTVRTPFREVYESGGVFLFDEYDGSHPSATLPFNAALANGHCAFPDRIVERHKDFVAIAAANTFGLGATAEYVGRNRLDAASLDRFVTIAWETDEALEMATAGNAEWTRHVQAVRARAQAKGLKVIVSPRASYFGAALLAAGLERDVAEQLALRKGMTEEQWISVK